MREDVPLNPRPPPTRLSTDRSVMVARVSGGRAGMLRNLPLFGGALLTGLLVAAALMAPLLTNSDPTATALEAPLLGPDARYPLGSDHLGRDEFSRLLYGARTTLGTVGLLVAIVSLIAVTAGMVSGYYGGWIDTVLMGLVDMVGAFPGIVLALAIAGTLGPGLASLMIALALVGWAGYARLVRGLVLAERSQPYVEAARALGSNALRIMALHVARNILGPVVVLASLDVGWMIATLAGLSFLGLGAQPPAPEWGAMLNEARPFLQSEPRLVIYPALAICFAVLGFNLLGDGLRDALARRTS